MFLSTTPRNCACSVAAFLALAIRRKAIGPTMVLCSFSRRYFASAFWSSDLVALTACLDHLAHRIAERRQVIAERIDLGFDGALGVGLEERLGAVEIHALLRQPGVVVDDAVEQRTQILHHGGELQADHAAAENLDVVADPDLVDGAQDAGRIRRIGRDIDDVGLGRLERADDAENSTVFGG